MAEPPGYGPPYSRPDFDPADPLISADYVGWWRRSLRVIGRTWPRLLAVQVIGAVALFVSDLVLSRLAGWFVESDQSRGLRVVTEVTASIVDTTVTSLMTLVMVFVVILSADGREPTLPECLRGALRRLLPVLGWSVVAALLVTVGLALCILPGVYFLLVLIPLVPVVAVERRQGVGRCFELFPAGSVGWTRNGTLLALTALGFTVLGFVEAAVGTAELRPGADIDPLAVALSSVAAAAGVILTGPLTVTAYADLRARREPLRTADLAGQLLRP
ncbi:hypothetical protein ACIBSW_28560 [Actinoplanes sp. NPDC049668]|uniref:hypothetical protein n=1 Tax=unclassified Actinoplanes TaxID=2626549 RepID=UPI0033BEB9BD